MKKFLKGAAILTAMVLALAFVGCKDEEEEGSKGADFTNTTDVKSLNDLVGTWSATLKGFEDDRGADEETIGGTTYKYNEKRKLTGEMQFIITKGSSDDTLNLDHKVLKGFVMIIELTITEPKTIAEDVAKVITEYLEEMGGEVARDGNKFTATITFPEDTPMGSAIIKIDDDKCFAYEEDGVQKTFLIKLNDVKNGIEFYPVDGEEPEYRATKK